MEATAQYQPYSPLLKSRNYQQTCLIDPIIQNSQSFSSTREKDSARDMDQTRSFVDSHILQYKASQQQQQQQFNNTPYINRIGKSSRVCNQQKLYSNQKEFCDYVIDALLLGKNSSNNLIKVLNSKGSNKNLMDSKLSANKSNDNLQQQNFRTFYNLNKSPLQTLNDSTLHTLSVSRTNHLSKSPDEAERIYSFNRQHIASKLPFNQTRSILKRKQQYTKLKTFNKGSFPIFQNQLLRNVEDRLAQRTNKDLDRNLSLIVTNRDNQRIKISDNYSIRNFNSVKSQKKYSNPKLQQLPSSKKVIKPFLTACDYQGQQMEKIRITPLNLTVSRVPLTLRKNYAQMKMNIHLTDQMVQF